MTEPRDPPPGRSGGTILYIDDNLINQRLVSRIFERQGGTVRVVPALLGREGLDLALDGPDLILLDLHLPDLHGEEVLALLKEDPATGAIPVIVLSADASPGVAERLVAQGARAYLTKPIAIPELLGVVRQYLAQEAEESDVRPPWGA